MSKLLAVFGATGNQGGSVVDAVLKDPELSKRYKVRGITRDMSTKAALELKEKGVDVVTGNIAAPQDLASALEGAHTVFAITLQSFDSDPKTAEYASGKAIADASVAAGAQYIILSTLPHVSKISGGKYTKVASWDAKAEVEDYIRQLPIHSAFFAPGSFMQNWNSMMAPRKNDNGDFVVARHVLPSCQLPLIDIAGDTGKFVAAILAEPEKYEGQRLCAATKLYSMSEIVDIMAKKSGKTVKYVQLPTVKFQAILSNSVGKYADSLIEMMLFQQDFGYYGPKTKELVQWAAENARGQLMGFEEYLDNHPIAALQ